MVYCGILQCSNVAQNSVVCGRGVVSVYLQRRPLPIARRASSARPAARRGAGRVGVPAAARARDLPEAHQRDYRRNAREPFHRDMYLPVPLSILHMSAFPPGGKC